MYACELKKKEKEKEREREREGERERESMLHTIFQIRCIPIPGTMYYMSHDI